ncbi:MAG TPA: CocE/NonD family hydrolase [Nannocystaceae bacterium]|nr:CocE/NonD family hydrolase [Nannocystaceae bacterium]
MIGRSWVLALALVGCHRTAPDGIPPAAPDFARDAIAGDAKDTVVPLDRTAWVRTHYDEREVKIPMRDGVELYTAIYTPKQAKGPRPIMLNRTPYSVAPYGPEVRDGVGPSMELAEAGFIFVYQDVRGRWMSGGEFDDMRPHRVHERGSKSTDESTDTFDTIEWLLANVDGHNGKVGMWGISYPGFYAATGMIHHHPALVAVSPQAPIADWWFDDFHHHGALFLPHTFNFFATFGLPRPQPTSVKPTEFQYGTTDGYAFFMALGSLANAETKYMKGKVAFWTDAMAHPNYDEFWQSRNLLPALHDVAPHVLIVGGWFDAEDLYGPLAIYRTIEANEKVDNKLVMGPWRHGGWARDDGRRLGCIDFGSATSQHYREEIEAPFFRHHLDGEPEPEIAEASIFDTGAMKWHSLPSWPPAKLEPHTLWLGPGGALASKAPTAASGADAWVSDPNEPVPYTQAIAIGMIKEYMVEDQRFAARRADVLQWQTEPLAEDLTMAGPLFADVWLSTTAADGDVVVKLIDVLPDGTTMPLSPPDKVPPFACPTGEPKGVQTMGGYQMMVRSEVFRARYRDSYEHPKRMRSGVPTKIVVPLQDVLHTFRKGHRVMLQIQSTWFPLVDRNPQKWHDEIAKAPDDGFVAATHRVHRSRTHASALRFGTLAK